MAQKGGIVDWQSLLDDRTSLLLFHVTGSVTTRPMSCDCVADVRDTPFETIMSSFKHYGAVKLTHLFSQDRVAEIAAAADLIFVERDGMFVSGSLPDHLAPYQKRRTILLSDIPAADQLHAPIFADMARRCLGHEPTVQSDSFVREIVPGSQAQALPFHQDQTILNQPLVNVWIPLTPCGQNAPGLELAIRSNQQLLDVDGPSDSPIAVERARISEEAVLARFGADALWSPLFAPGDAMVFSGMTVHRTFLKPSMTERRLSVELRLA